MTTESTSKFDELMAVFDKRENIIENDLKDQVKLLEEILDYSFRFEKIINEANLAEFNKTNTKLTGPKALPLFYFHYRNNHYLLAAYKLCKIGLPSPGYAILRGVYETILHMYLTKLDENAGNLLFQYQVEELTQEGKKLLEKKRWYGHATTIKELYTQSTQKKLNQFYQLLCLRAHPNIKSSSADTIFAPEIVKDCILTASALGLANLWALLEISHDRLPQEAIIEALNFITEKSKPLEYPDLAPDKEEFKKTLFLRWEVNALP